MRSVEGQNTPSEQAKKDLRAALLAKERKHFAKKGGDSFEGAPRWRLSVILPCRPCCRFEKVQGLEVYLFQIRLCCSLPANALLQTSGRRT